MNTQAVKKGELAGDADNLFAVREAYRAIRTNIHLSLLKDGCKRIVFTSPEQGEGKTVTSCNIAFSMSQTDTRVLLVDADLRRPRVHRVMRLHNERGLSNVLGRLCSFEEAVSHTKYANLDVLTSGVKVPNPAELLAGESMQTLLQAVSERYDCILFDTPPVNVVSDAFPLIKMTDGVIVVLRQNYSTHPALGKSLNAFDMIGAKVLGVVMNSVKSEKNDPVYRRRGYDYGYPHNGDEKEVTK